MTKYTCDKCKKSGFKESEITMLCEDCMKVEETLKQVTPDKVEEVKEEPKIEYLDLTKNIQ